MNMHKYGYFESKIVISFEFLHILKNRRSTLKLYIYIKDTVVNVVH
jgi:hypothetical protein